jgi:hypothetical protein
VLAGGAQLGRELGGEQAGLAFDVELAFIVDDDFLDERAGAGGFPDGGHVDAVLAVVRGQPVHQGGLAGGVRALDRDDGTITQHRGHRAAR